MPITSEQDLEKARQALSSGIGDPEKLKAAIIKYQMQPHVRQVPVITSEAGLQKAALDMTPADQLPNDPVKTAIGNYSRNTVPASNSFLGWDPSKEKAGANANTGARERANAQGYNIDLSRPEAVILQPGETPGSIRLQQLRKKLEFEPGRPRTNATNLKVYSDPPEYVPATPPPSPFSPLKHVSPLSRTAYVGSEGTDPSKYFFEPTVAEFRNDVAKSPALQARLAKDFPHISDKLKSKVDDNDIEASDTFKAYQDSRWRLAYADAVKRGAPLYRLAYTKAIPDEQKSSLLTIGPNAGEANREELGGAFASGLGQGATLGLADPLKQAINPRMAEESRAQRGRNPGSAFVGDVVGSMAGAPRLLFGGLSKLTDKIPNKLTSAALAGGLTGGIDDSARQVGESVAESLDAHDAALEALARIQDRFDPMRAGMATGLGAVMAGGGHLLGEGANRWGQNIVTHPDRVDVINRNLDSGGTMSRTGSINVEPELRSLQSLSSRAGTNVEDALSSKMAKDVIKSQRLEQEAAVREGEAETAAMRAAMKRPVVKNGSMSMGSDSVPTGPAAQRIRALTQKLPDVTMENKALIRKINNFADDIAERKFVTPAEYDKLEAAADGLAKNRRMGSDPDPVWQKVAAEVRGMRDEFKLPDDATIVDRPPEYAVRDSKGESKIGGDYSNMNIRQKNRLDRLAFENEALGIPNPDRTIKVRPKQADVQLDVLEDGEPGGLFNRKPRSVISAVQETGPETNVGPNTEKAVAGNIRAAARTDAPDVVREKIIRAGIRSGPNFERGMRLIRQAQDRGEYQQMLGKLTNGLSVSNFGPRAGGKLSPNQLLRIVPTLKGLAGGRPTPPTVEPTNLLNQAIEELFGSETRAPISNPKSIIGQETQRSGAEIMDKFVPELGGGILRLGGSKLPSAAESMYRKGKEQSVLQKLTPQEQKQLVEIISNLAEMNPETP